MNPSQRTAPLVARLLSRQKLRLVLAESCTGGMIASLLTEIPGISRHFCGSAVVYRDLTKISWLGVKKKTLEKFGAVSLEAATEMARGILSKTPEAHIAVAITGYLGPDAPSGGLGRVIIAIALRSKKEIFTKEIWVLPKSSVLFRKKNLKGRILRNQRQMLASQAVLSMVRSLLNRSAKSKDFRK